MDFAKMENAPYFSRQILLEKRRAVSIFLSFWYK